MRSSGILLNISSLPGDYGIGGFGDEIGKFANFLKSADCRWWQILPLTKIGLGNSPYSGESAFAGNYLYIDPKRLLKNKLITEEECIRSCYSGSPYVVDYEFVKKSKGKLIRSAYERIIKSDSGVLYKYMDENREWLLDYALYMTLKLLNNGKPWYEWEDRYKFREETAISELIDNQGELIGYFTCEQYLFDSQWQAAREEIHSYGVGVIGDMPIYVSYDSADVWAHPELFQLDKDGRPDCVAGVPPDYFAKEGQLWGNPLYNYDVMRKDSYSWFLSRIGRMAQMYDMLRIDHFRAFDQYWSVKYGSKNAIEGEWRKGAGIELFDAIKSAYPNLKIIAEDLGIIDEGVIKLRDAAGLPGMRVLQFAFDGDNSPHLPHNYTRESVAYTGTHDNNTTFGWLYELTPVQRAKLDDYCGIPTGLEGGYNSPQVWACIRTVLTSCADTVIIPFQDICGWGADTRMNIPGVSSGNWSIRIVSGAIDDARVDLLRRLNYISARNR